MCNIRILLIKGNSHLIKNPPKYIITTILVEVDINQLCMCAYVWNKSEFYQMSTNFVEFVS